jgi:uncharacterized protein (TIGR02186 family)
MKQIHFPGKALLSSRIYVFFALCFSLCIAAASVYAEEMKISASPTHIQITAFYNGSHVKVTGEIPSGADVAIRLKGVGEEVHLKKKGQVGGLLWMNTGKIIFKNVPDVFMVYTTGSVASMLDDPSLHLGYWSVSDEVEVEPASEDKKFLFGEFIKLKESNGVYIIDKNSIKYNGESGGKKQFEAELFIPPKMKPGTYKIEAFAIQDGKIVANANVPFTLELVGFPRWISDLAWNHSLLFGLMAVFVALGAGLAIGMIFRGGGGAH